MDATNPPSIEADLAGGWRVLTRDEVEQRRFPGAIRPDQRVTCSTQDGQICIVDDAARSEVLAYVAQLQPGAHSAPRQRFLFCEARIEQPVASSAAIMTQVHGLFG